MGILLAGPPGTGKNAIAEAMAKEPGFNFVEVRNIRPMAGESEEGRMLKEQARCPSCRSTKVRQYIYGRLASFKSDKERDEFREKYIAGGCMRGWGEPTYHCDECGKDFK